MSLIWFLDVEVNACGGSHGDLWIKLASNFLSNVHLDIGGVKLTTRDLHGTCSLILLNLEQFWDIFDSLPWELWNLHWKRLRFSHQQFNCFYYLKFWQRNNCRCQQWYFYWDFYHWQATQVLISIVLECHKLVVAWSYELVQNSKYSVQRRWGMFTFQLTSPFER